MLPEDIQRLRSSLKLARTAFAQFLGVSEITVVRWESGTDTAPRGLQLVLLNAMKVAVERGGVEAVKQIVSQSALDHGRAIQALTNLAFGGQKAPSGIRPR